jgi:hypothetical protein
LRRSLPKGALEEAQAAVLPGGACLVM